MSRRTFRFAVAAMREARMLRMFSRLVAASCLGLFGLGVVVQFDPSGPVGVVRHALQLAVTLSALVFGLRWLLRPWPPYRHAVAFVVWADAAVAVVAVTMTTPDSRLCTTLYAALTAVFVAFLLGGRILLAHCLFCGSLVAGITGWAVLFEHQTVLGLFAIYMPALVWTVVMPLSGLALIDVGRHSIRRTVKSAQHDPLTGLRNRRGMHAAVTATMRRTSPASVLIAVCDIDRFKAFNDGQGHAAGDAALLSVARKLQSLVSGNEIAARIGGDEFVLVAFMGSGYDRSILLSRLDPLTHGEVDGLPLTASVGIAWYPVGGPHFSIDDAIRHADAAMYEAKRSGGARCAIYGTAVELG